MKYGSSLAAAENEFGGAQRIESGARRRTEWRAMWMPTTRALFFATVALFLSTNAMHATPAHSVGNAQPASRRDDSTTAVILDFPRLVPDPLWNAMKYELEQDTVSAWPERQILWMKREDFHTGMDFPEVVQVKLVGRCTAEPLPTWQATAGPLGWAYLVDGQIRPMAYIDCDRIAVTVERELRGATCAERRERFARALARVVAHELTHIFEQSRNHAKSGLQRAHLSARDLTKNGAL
jgi:hypothetical protein